MCTKNIPTGFVSEIALSVTGAVVYSTQDCPNDQYRYTQVSHCYAGGCAGDFESVFMLTACITGF